MNKYIIDFSEFYKKDVINNFYTDLEIIEERENSGDLDIEDYEIERQKLLISSLQEFFGGKYFELNNKTVRISDHKQGTIYHSPSDYSFVIKRGNSTSGNDYTIPYYEDIKDAIDYILNIVI